MLDPLQAEWMAFDRPAGDGAFTIPLTGSAEAVRWSFLPNTNDWFSSPFADADQVVRVSGRFRQFDTLRETLTFRRLPVTTVHTGLFGDEYGIALNAPLTQTTPSGITIRLPRQSPEDQRAFANANSINVFVDISPKQIPFPNRDQTVSLPKSPLQSASGKSPKVTIAFAGLNTESSYSDDSQYKEDEFRRLDVSLDDGMRTFDLKSRKLVQHPLPKIIDLTVTIDQRVDLEETPFAFTLPVRDIGRSEWKTKPWTVVQQ
jgi:hypothetical protein